MNESNTELIEALTRDHGARPWWKSFYALFAIWFSFHLLYFTGLSFLRLDILELRSSALYLVFVSVGMLFSGWIFILLARGTELKTSFLKMGLISIIIWMISGIFFEYAVMGSIDHHRAMSVTTGDMNCFWHSVASTALPLLVFPLLFKNFFFARPVWAMTFMSFHLAFTGSLLTELKCSDRELWHLFLGHQTVVIGVVILMVAITYAAQNLVFLKTSGREKWKP